MNTHDNANSNESKPAHLPDGELVVQVQREMQRLNLPQRDLASRLGVSHRVLARWLNGEPRPATIKIEKAAKAWLTARPDPKKRPDDSFVETRTSERILSALAYAQASGDLVTIYGGPGVGKTRTLSHYRGMYDDVWVATMTPSCSTVVPALEEICEAVGLQDVTGGARRLARAVRSKVHSTRGLLIIDEAQHLSQGAIEEIRSIHDYCCNVHGHGSFGLALVGNEQVYARLTGGSRAATFAQLFSRLGMKLYLKRPTGEDVRALAKRYRVTDEKALDVLERVASRPGALRAVVKVCRLAQQATRGEIDQDAVRAAVDNLGAEV